MNDMNGGVYYAPERKGPEWKMDWEEHISHILWIYHDAGQITANKNELCLWPRRCYLTRKWLWLKRCTRLKRDYGFPQPRIEEMWFDPKAYTMFLLKERRDYI